MVKEPNRFSKLSLEAIAMAIPPIPKPVASAATFTLKILLITVSDPKIMTSTLVISMTKGTI